MMLLRPFNIIVMGDIVFFQFIDGTDQKINISLNLIRKE